ncbi:Ig-like domain-containing protein [Aliivibrio fischeri]|uniref:Ig-like domain-containing protein n=1 Tax=Aliivibrio fischeri TaxID=668 RepID=UPI00080D9C7C|nr:Ig-like domain-containing protein [Aliivibrio fischeri]OCH48159.1 hypothetical protein A6E02_08495 [Aliivibrio fischeri]
MTCFFLFGCGPIESQPNNSKDYNNVNKYITVTAPDSYDFVQIKKNEATPHRVSVVDNIKLSDEKDVKLNDLKLMSSDPSCRVISKDNKGFVISAVDTGLCDYQYDITIGDGTSDYTLVGKTEGIIRVVLSNDSINSKLIPFGVVGYENEVTNINIIDELAKVSDFTDLTDYTLESDVVIAPLGSSSIVDVNPSNNTISYTPAPTFIGTEQLLFNFKNSSGDILVGTAIVTIAKSNKPSIDLPDKIHINDLIEINKNVPIDISAYISSDTVGNDQLVYVSSFDALVSLADPTLVNNKIFNFQADEAGLFYVNIVVTDHHGGYDIALLEISVTDPLSSGLWDDIFDSPYVYSAPLTKSGADSLGVDYDAAYYDGGYTPKVNIATFLISKANKYCKTKGSLPTSTQLKDFSKRFNLSGLYNWPIGRGYISSDAKIVDLKTGSEMVPDGQPYYVTCLSEGTFDLNLIKDTAIANGTDTAIVEALIKLNNQPVENVTLLTDVTSTSGLASVNNKHVTTNSEGKATIEITDTASELVDVTVTLGKDSRTQTVAFGGDPATAEVKEISAPITSISYSNNAKVRARLLDAMDNPVPKQVISFETDTSDTALKPTSDVKTDVDGYADIEVEWTGSDLDYDTRVWITAKHTSTDKGPTQLTQAVDFIGGILSEFIRTDTNTGEKATVSAKVVNKYGLGLANRIVTFKYFLFGDVDFGYGASVYECKPGSSTYIYCLDVFTDSNGIATTNVYARSSDPSLKAQISAAFGGQSKDLDLTFNTLRDVLKTFEYYWIGNLSASELNTVLDPNIAAYTGPLTVTEREALRERAIELNGYYPTELVDFDSLGSYFTTMRGNVDAFAQQVCQMIVVPKSPTISFVAALPYPGLRPSSTIEDFPLNDPNYLWSRFYESLKAGVPGWDINDTYTPVEYRVHSGQSFIRDYKLQGGSWTSVRTSLGFISVNHPEVSLPFYKGKKIMCFSKM